MRTDNNFPLNPIQDAGGSVQQGASSATGLITVDDGITYLRNLGFTVDQIASGSWQIYGRNGVDLSVYGPDRLRAAVRELDSGLGRKP